MKREGIAKKFLLYQDNKKDQISWTRKHEKTCKIIIN